MTTLGSRMKSYEQAYKSQLTARMPVLIRIDGKAFHTYTKGMNKPFDEGLTKAMQETSKYLAENIAGCKLAYTQSDEISLLLTNDEKLTTEAWYKNNLQKMVSVSASLATAKFNEEIKKYYPNKPLALFDSRVWIVPKEEVNNYFVWRQQDATRNSIQMVAQDNFSQQELQGLNSNMLQDKLFLEQGINWSEYDPWKRRGSCVVKEEYFKEETKRSRWVIDNEIPLFTSNKEYVNKLIKLNQE